VPIRGGGASVTSVRREVLLYSEQLPEAGGSGHGIRDRYQVAQAE
jgi:hypothetical protein